MKKITFVALAVMLFVTMACGFTFDVGGTPAPQQVAPSVQVPEQPAQQPQAPLPQVLPTATLVSVVPTVAPVSDPPTITTTGPVDCLPYPSFQFLYIDGIETGVTLQVLNKAEPQLSEPGVNWWEVKFNDGGADFDCWVYGGGSHVTTSGDFSQVKVRTVIIPPPPKNHCDTAVKLAKAQIGVKVRLPYKQAPWMGRTGWFDGMSEYSGKIGQIIAIAGLDLSWCQTVYVAVFGYDTDYAWRVRDLDFSVK